VLGSNPVAMRPKAFVCGLSIAGIASWSPVESMGVRLLCLWCPWRPLL
jgi:hypothetical protein